MAMQSYVSSENRSGFNRVASVKDDGEYVRL